MPQRPNNFTINRNHPLAQGLVFAGLGAHESSVLYHDGSPYGKNGTLTNMDPAVDWVMDGKIGRMRVDLDGTNDYVSFPSSLMPLGDFTFSAWVSIGVNTASRRHMLWSGASDRSSIILRYSTGQIVTAYDYTESGYWNTGITWDVNEWHLHTFTRYGTVWTGYWDGKTTGTFDFTTHGFSEASYFTRFGNDGNYPMLGSIADPLIHSRVLSVSEIQQISDRSNVMLSGLINTPRRKWWPVVSGAAVFKPYWANQATQVAM